MTMKEVDAELARRAAARRAVADKEYETFLDLCALEGGRAEIEGTEERHEVRLWLRRHLRRRR